MSRRCTVCNHPERAAIDSVLVSGASSNRRVASQHGFSEAAVRRHRSHIPRELLKAQEAREIVSADDLLGQVDELRGRALGILAQTEASGKFTAACSAIREARSCLELQARMIAAALELKRDGGGMPRIREIVVELPADTEESELDAEIERELAELARRAEGCAACPPELLPPGFRGGEKPQLSNEFSYEKGR